MPGIVIYGPTERVSDRDYQTIVWKKVYPAWMELPEQRRYSEGWSQIRVQEFTTRRIASQACLYAFLAYGELSVE